MRSDNLDMGAVPEWVYRVDSPPEVDDEPWTLIGDLAASERRVRELESRGAVVGLALLALAFAAGVVVGVLVPR